MPPPHVHPSVNCYKNHSCRCDGCRAAWTQYQRDFRERRARATYDPDERTQKRILSPDEVTRLRRLLGVKL